MHIFSTYDYCDMYHLQNKKFNARFNKFILLHLYYAECDFLRNIILWNAHRNFIEIIQEVRANGREVKTKDHRFPCVVPNAAYRETAVHYFLMSNKAISMCPDQGPQVLTRVISPGSPACATSSSERRTLLSLFSFLRHFPSRPPLRRTTARSRDYSAPPETRDAGCCERARARVD